MASAHQDMGPSCPSSPAERSCDPRNAASGNSTLQFGSTLNLVPAWYRCQLTGGPSARRLTQQIAITCVATNPQIRLPARAEAPARSGPPGGRCAGWRQGGGQAGGCAMDDCGLRSQRESGHGLPSDPGSPAMAVRKRHHLVLPSWPLAGSGETSTRRHDPAPGGRQHGFIPRLARAASRRRTRGAETVHGPLSTGCDHHRRERVPGLILHRRSPQRSPPTGRP